MIYLTAAFAIAYLACGLRCAAWMILLAKDMDRVKREAVLDCFVDVRRGIDR